MNDLRGLIVETMNDDGIESLPQGREKTALTIIIGGCNSVHARNVVQFNAEKLPETIESITQGLKDVPPESIEKIAEPLARLVDAIADLIARNKA